MKSYPWLRFVLAACVLPLCAHGPLLAVANSDSDTNAGLPDGGLHVTRSHTHATLSWTLPDSGFVIEWATGLDSTDWRGVSEMLTITDRYCEVTVPLDPGPRYFRLRTRGAGADAFSPAAVTGDGEGVSSPAVTNGYFTAVLRSECTSAPTPPPPVGEIAVGPGYVIMTVANGDPLDYLAAQQVVTDAIFESLMPLYCGLPRGGCVTNRVQWNLVTYDAGGNPRISGGPPSGPGYHYCAVTNGYITAVIRGESATLPLLPPVGQVAVGADSVIMTIADSDPTDLGAAQRLATDAVFESLMRRYCALPRGTGLGYVSGRAQWHVMTFDSDGTSQLSACAASGCDFHECVVSRGFITAVLRSECTSAPTLPPPVGGITVGADYVIMTVADGDPLDYRTAQQFATDAVLQSLMPLYCELAESPTRGCVRDRVQWNLLTYDAGGNPKVSGSPVSGPAFHYFGPCSLTPQERVQNLVVWVEVDVAAGILDRRDGHRLTTRLDAVLRQLARGTSQNAINKVTMFLDDVDALVKTERLPAPAAQPLIDGALAIVAQLGG